MQTVIISFLYYLTIIQVAMHFFQSALDTGRTKQYPIPFSSGGDSAYASILSVDRYYTHFNSYFFEFDISKMSCTFIHKTTPQMAMSMTRMTMASSGLSLIHKTALFHTIPKLGISKTTGIYINRIGTSTLVT